MADPTYVTLDDFKKAYGIPATDLDDDDYIKGLLVGEENNIQKKLGYSFGEETDREDEWVASIERIVIPPKVPISDVDTLKISDISINNDYYDISKDAFYLWLDSSYDFGRETVEIYLKYTCGYTVNTLPEAIKRVIYLNAGMLFGDQHTVIQSREGSGPGHFIHSFETNQWIKSVIEDYKLRFKPSGGKV